jgi:hypothetical protein
VRINKVGVPAPFGRVLQVLARRGRSFGRAPASAALCSFSGLRRFLAVGDRMPNQVEHTVPLSASEPRDVPSGRALVDVIAPSVRSSIICRVQMTPLGGQLPRWFILALIAVAGLILILLPEFIDTRGNDVVSREIGAALLIVVILAFTIDRWIKADLLEDVVEATLGAVILDDFRGELRRLLGYDFICEFHNMSLVVENIDDPHVRVSATVERRLRNISTSAKELQNMVSIDDWGIPGHSSSIEECKIVNSVGEVKNFRAVTYPNVYGMKAETEKILVPPNGTAILISKQSEIKYRNDHAIGVYLSPTKDPMMRITMPDDLEYDFEFGRPPGPGETIDRSPQTHRYQLKGYIFRQPKLKLRWWPKGWSVNQSGRN